MAHQREQLLQGLRGIMSAAAERHVLLQRVADLLRSSGDYRWVGIYEVDQSAGLIMNLVFSGPSPPEYPSFPIAKGLSGAAVAERKTVNVSNVAADPRYLTAFGSTRSEIIVPILGETEVVGTIDVESELENAFDATDEATLEACARVIQPLWDR